MRLARLDLTRYGKFTDFKFDFGSKEPGKPDFHVIFGPNEAGKTTTLTAFLDLLFGIGKTNPYNFLHPSDTMEIGGILEYAGSLREFRRIRKQLNSLLDVKGQPVPEIAILGELGGLGREDYKLKFSLDADTLEKGGQNILASKGDLGELLFSASAGVTDLSLKLNNIREKIDTFFKKGTRKNGLADLKNQIKQLDERKKQIDTLATHYSSLVANHKKATELYDKAMKERTDALKEATKIERVEGALPRLETLTGIVEKLKLLGDIPEAPPGMKEKVLDLQKLEVEHNAELKTALQNAADLAAEIETIVIDEKALGFADRLSELEKGKSLFISAEEDLPKRRPRIIELNGKIVSSLLTLGRKGDEKPHELVLDATITSKLRTLMENWAGVDTELTNAKTEADDAEEKLEDETEKLTKTQALAGITDPAALKVLGSVVHEIRRAGPEAARDHVASVLTAHREDLVEKLKPLAPWRGSADDLAFIRVPNAAEIEGWKTAIEKAANAVNGHADKIEHLTTELSELQAQRDASAATAGVVSDSEAAQKRTERESAWAEHRRLLDAETANIFENRLRADDLATNARFNHATEVAKINATLEGIVIKEKALERLQQLWKQTSKTFETVRSQVGAAIKAVSTDFPDTITPAEFSNWAALFEKAVGQRNKVKESERDLREAEEHLTAIIQKLSKAMKSAGITHECGQGLETMMLLSQAALDEATVISTQGQAVDQSRRDLSKRLKRLVEAQKAIDKWQQEWNKTCGACWIAQTHASPSIALVREILDKLDEMRPLLSERDGLEDRVKKMELNETNFTNDVFEFAHEMKESIDGQSVLVLTDRLSARIKAASEKSLLQKGKLNDLQKARTKVKDCRETITINLTEMQQVFAYLGVETLAAAAAKLDEANTKANLLARKAEEESHITKALDVGSMEEAEIILKTLDAAALSTQKAAAKNQFTDADERQRQYHTAKCNAEALIEAIGGDASVALIEEQRRTICLEIQDKARQWMRLRAGIVAAERALRVYREKHCSSMLSNASEAFATISRGAYSKLTTKPEGTGETLVGLVATGGSRTAEEMSKGTRFQLYLALRVAGYQEYANSREPPMGVPFIADDIMETYDDFRAEEAFRVLSQMAEVGQVIYLTHHEHLCGIARKVCPDVRIHGFEPSMG